LTAVAALGEAVGPGERPLAILHARDETSFARAASAVRAAFTVGDGPPAGGPEVLETIR
jgi:thymidine phosphorylase